MILTRRGALGGLGAAACALAAPPLAIADTADRRFTLFRDGANIGWHTISLTRQGERLEVAIDIQIRVKVFGFTGYRYEMSNREVWERGGLVSMDSSVNDDGERKRVTVRRADNALRVDGPNYQGDAPLDAATTTYFTRDFLERPVWISTDAGDLLEVRRDKLGAARVPGAQGRIPATRWTVTDGDAYTVDVAYDDRGEWVGLAFDASGERCVYRLETEPQRFAALWTG